MGGYGSGYDDLEGELPTRHLRTAKQSAPMARPRPSSATLDLTGSHRTVSLMTKMQAVEQLVREISIDLPEVANSFGPAIQLMRDLGVAKLADQSAGGVGATNPEAAALPSMGAGPGGVMPPPPINF